MTNPSELHFHSHAVLLPSAGAGHLIPCLRLAATLIRHGCRVTLLTVQHTVSNAEQQLILRFLSSFPHHCTNKQFHVESLSPGAGGADAFWLHVEAIGRSAHLLPPLLLDSSVSPPPSVFISDVALSSAVLPVVTQTLRLPFYGLFVSSALMFSLLSYFPAAVIDADAALDSTQAIEIPGLPAALPVSFLPPVLLNTDSLFARIFLENGRDLRHLRGVFINTFGELEQESLAAINGGKVGRELPPLIPMGPLLPCEFEKGGSPDNVGAAEWLDSQPENSVVFVCFGNRTALPEDQLREIGEGLIKSGFRFLWVVKTKIVDRDETEELAVVLGGDLYDRATRRGLVMNEWVDQAEILSHRAVGGFVSHAGWNSVVESVWYGVPMVVWPLGGDQRVNAAVVERCGVAVWPRGWGWCGEAPVVDAAEIGDRVREVMGSESVRATAARMRDEARGAVRTGGASEVALKGVIEGWAH